MEDQTNRDEAVRTHDRHQQTGIQIREATISNGNNALKYLILINGGACIAMLAFFSSVIEMKNSIIELSSVVFTISYFAIGVAMATLSAMAGYLTNFFIEAYHHSFRLTFKYPYSRQSSTTSLWACCTETCRVITYVSALISLGLFFYGIWEIRDAILLDR